MLRAFLSRFVKEGTLSVIEPNGKVRVYGSSTPQATVRVHTWHTAFWLGLQPELKFGEAYMDGTLTVERGDIADVLAICAKNCGARRLPAMLRFIRFLRRCWRPIAQFNPASRARRNVAHHYDLSGKLYDLFLDADRQYSCAYFETPRDSLEQAQAAKKRHIAAKLNLVRPGLKVLDIGSGWGGLALDLARNSGAEVMGVTLSTEQLALARQRARTAGLADRCHFELQDYRAVKGCFDRIVSVGMFEHVGRRYYDAFFAKAKELLADDGVMLLHTIGRSDGPGATNPWITKYIFPGGYAPALSEILPAIERAGLAVTDIEVLRQHYAETLKAWRLRFRANWAKATALYDERFCRMWEFYLAGSEMTFRYDHEVVFQIQIAKRVDSLPMTRDYLGENKRRRSEARNSAAA